jgi:5-enolpyruvylshikimate-3-phosphate synthase
MIDSVLIKGNVNSIDINIDILASKSFTQRILACAYICKGVSLIKGVGKSNDELALLHIIKNLGAKVIDNKSYLEVHSNYPSALLVFNRWLLLITQVEPFSGCR